MESTKQLNPLELTEKINDDYNRYLRTIYFFQEPNLRQQFWQALDQPDFLVKGPILEASLPFKSGRSLHQMVDANIIHPGFRELCSPELPFDRTLYHHQDQSVEKIVKHKRNLVVSTGTGSGKTETFLIPIFDYLLHERAQGTLHKPGVRALLLYPMNALANDQVKRLRRILKNFPDITFGRYVGESEEKQSDAERLFAIQFPNEPKISNELISREQMRSNPPHILMTNFAMLEYLLLRPKDSEFFDGQTGNHWRFLVLDEAHIYDGAAGIELAMLIRRLKDRIVKSEQGQLRCIATSATLGKGKEDYPSVVQFATQLFGEKFEWVDEDSAKQDVVAGERVQNAHLSRLWGNGYPKLYADLAHQTANNVSVADLISTARTHLIPESVITNASNAANLAAEYDDAKSRFLHAILSGDENLHRLRNAVMEPHQLTQLIESLANKSSTVQEIIDLINLAVQAKPSPNDVALLPARYHVFARALEGAFVCLNSNHPTHKEAGKPFLFLKRHTRCPHCEARVFEIATCPRCGTAYLVGSEESHSDQSSKILTHPSATNEELTPNIHYYVFDSEIQVYDEDEVIVAGESLEQLTDEQVELVQLCLGCGALGKDGQPIRCKCEGKFSKVSLQHVRSVHAPLRRCVRCGVRSSNGVVYRFLTGRDAPVSVLATSLYQQIPPAGNDQTADLPGEGRKLMIFADSRQDAAFFAPYLERTYRQVLRRRLILSALNKDSSGRLGQLRLEDVATRVQKEAEQGHLFTLEQSVDQRHRQVMEWLTQEFIALDMRIGLEGLGLLHFRPVVKDSWQPPSPLLSEPWTFTVSEVTELISILLHSVRQQGAITFPDNVDVRSTAFAPRNVQICVSEYADDKQYVIGWLPKRGSNRRLDFLQRLLQSRAPKLDSREIEAIALDTLRKLWTYLTASNSPWSGHFIPQRLRNGGVAYQLNYKLWEWIPCQAVPIPIYFCTRCFNISYQDLNHLCPQYGCKGELRKVNESSPVWNSNHYRHIYRSMPAIQLSVEEHTAQWMPTKASKVQSDFIDGKINALSCSTTFELGVDVGELQMVLMRNVPPTTANYIQRAGRAGRRRGSAAFVLTFAQRRSHDLHYFNQPETMVAGRIIPPTLTIANEKIVRRHMHSVFLSGFLRWAIKEHARSFQTVADFFSTDGRDISGVQLMHQYAALQPVDLMEAIQRIMPPELETEINVNDWEWLEQLMRTTNGGGILDRVELEVQHDLELYAGLERNAVTNKNYRQADYFKSVARTVQQRDLLGFLGKRNVLPKYGFPVDVVDFRTEHVPITEAKDVDLDRDLRVAIAEFAPGSEVVAAKKIWTGDGIYRMPGRDWQRIHYAVCPNCGRFHRSLQPLDSSCIVCGSNIFGWPKRHGEFIIPEFGFVANKETSDPGDRRPQRSYASQIFFSDYDTEQGHEPPVFEPVPEVSGAGIEVSRRYSRFGKLAVVNSGIANSGFRVCSSCGWAERMEPTPPGTKPKQKREHNNPRTGLPCTSRSISTVHLGHEFITDVMEIRFAGYFANDGHNDLWLSLLYAMLEGLSEVLGIARDDLNGTVYPYSAGLPPALILFDNVPGGAGHVRRLNNGAAFVEVMRQTLQRVAKCECGKETSCYECLRNFYNQYVHEQLQRGLVVDFLSQLLNQH